MGAGQIGGIASMLDMDFDNAAGFLGTPAENSDAQFVVYYMSHALLFCAGALIEAHVVLTTASCVHGERYKFDVFGGTHKFVEFTGISRTVQHVCLHRGYNHTGRWSHCSLHNIALLVLGKQFSVNTREIGSDFIINRIRYSVAHQTTERYKDETCEFYGWGSRRNGLLVPLMINLYKVKVNILSPENCMKMWNTNNSFLCLAHPPCRNERFGALCPDDMGSVVVCSGYIQGIMTSRLVDRPCGVGFLDTSAYSKFLTCGVDNARDVFDGETLEFDYTKSTVTLITTPAPTSNKHSDDRADQPPPPDTRGGYDRDIV